MTCEPHGEVTGAFPATTKGFSGMVMKIIVRPNPAATGIVSVQAGGVTIASFNTPAATGPLDHPLCICGGDGDRVDPTVYSIVPDGASHGAFVTYWAD